MCFSVMHLAITLLELVGPLCDLFGWKDRKGKKRKKERKSDFFDYKKYISFFNFSPNLCKFMKKQEIWFENVKALSCKYDL